MHVTLDEEQWVASAKMTLGEVFAEVSDRAHARSRIVTRMRLDEREITDRDLDVRLMAESAGRYERLVAVSQSVQDLEHEARIAAGRFAKLLHAEGAALLAAWRTGQPQEYLMDQWLGKLADYLEFTEGQSACSFPGGVGAPLSSWVQELLRAREQHDTVLAADLLEYEILPRLAG